MKKKNLLRRAAAGSMAAILAIGLTACQEDPDGSIVAHKDMDKLISQAAASDPAKVELSGILEENTRNYKTTVENESLGVTLKVDAQVDVPQADKLNMYRVEQMRFEQDFIDKVIAELMGGQSLYDGGALRINTKSQLEQQMKAEREMMESEEANMRQEMAGSGYSQEEIENDVEVYKSEWQQSLDRLQEEYESAPTELDLSQYPSDGKISSIFDTRSQILEDVYYSWQKDMASDGDQVLYAVTDGSDGQYRFLYVQNNADYSNTLSWRSSPNKYLRQGGVYVDITDLSLDDSNRRGGSFEFDVGDEDAYWREKGLPLPVLPSGFAISQDVEFEALYPDTTISMDEAKEKAGELLRKLGLEDFAFSDGGQFTELLSTEQDYGKLCYGNYYILHYLRMVDGVMLTQSSGTKHAEGWNEGGDTYNKQFWPGEFIELRVNDSGVVGFDFIAPLNFIETVVEGAAIKTFDEVKESFEQMLPVTLGSKEYTNVAQIDKVRLSYSRISEKDSFDTGLVVPVWSFEGKNTSYGEGQLAWEDVGTLLAINAIDGSVIDAELGY